MKNRLLYFNILIGLSVLVLLFHLLILVRVIPYEITWGGRLKSVEDMYVFEAVSILINLFYMFLLLQKAAYMRYIIGAKTVTLLLWAFFLLYALNTIGNAVAKTNFEKCFGILTLLNAALIWVVNKPKQVG